MSETFMDRIKNTAREVRLQKIEEENKRIFQAKTNTYTVYNEIMKQLTLKLYQSIATQIQQYTLKGFNNIYIEYELGLLRRYLNEIIFEKDNMKQLHIFEKLIHDHDIDNDPYKKDFECLEKDLEGPLQYFLLDVICNSKNEGEKFKKILLEWFKNMIYPDSDYLTEFSYEHLKGLGVHIENNYEETKLLINLAW